MYHNRPPKFYAGAWFCRGMKKKTSRFAAWRTQLADRLAGSSRVFLITLLVLLGIEVIVDWNQTLVEINVLRDQIRQKGMNYAGLLSRTAIEPILSADRPELQRLASGILDDEDAIYVRITDMQGRLIFDQVNSHYDQRRTRAGMLPFRVHYAHLLDRDARGITHDPEGFRHRLANSRYRDLPQIWGDMLANIIARFSPPPPLPASRARIVYQDRLRDANHRRDDSTTWAITPIDAAGEPLGAILVAFDMRRTNSAVRMKYVKGIGIVVFFVGLMVIQNILGRRDKLRLLDLERRYARAKSALQDALPTSHSLTLGAISVQGILSQAGGRVDGLVWDVARCDLPGLAPDAPPTPAVTVLVVDPDGDGIDAAIISLHTLQTFRARRQARVPLNLADEIAALGNAAAQIPLTRPIGILLLHINPTDGRFEAVSSDIAALRMLAPGTDTPPATVLGEPGTPRDGTTSKDGSSSQSVPSVSPSTNPDMVAGLAGTLSRAQGTLPAGHTLLCACAGSQGEGSSIARDVDVITHRFGALRQKAQHPLDDLTTWVRARLGRLSTRDVALITVLRSEDGATIPS